MPRLNQSLPRYRKHKASGQAVVHLSGQDFYLGPHGTKTSRLEYDRRVSEWLQRGRALPDARQSELLLTPILVAFVKHANRYYQKNGNETREFGLIKEALAVVRPLYGKRPVSEFGPLALQTVQQKMVDKGWTRKHINKQIGRIIRMFKWAASNELVSADIYHALQTVPGLKQGRTEAPDNKPVEPVAEADIEAALAVLNPIVADMVRFQRLTACRPEEVCWLRPCNIDRSNDIWRYYPSTHKTEHHGRRRVICIGPKAQAILEGYLDQSPDRHCFSPMEAQTWTRNRRSTGRKTPMSCGNRPGTNCKANPRRQAKSCYTTDSYRRAIHRACEKAKIAKWSPNRLRHSAGTDIRAKFGLEASQCVLGHAKADVTQIYAERDMQTAIKVATEVG